MTEFRRRSNSRGMYEAVSVIEDDEDDNPLDEDRYSLYQRQRQHSLHFSNTYLVGSFNKNNNETNNSCMYNC